MPRPSTVAVSRNRPHLSIVLPAHNEAERITPTLEAFATYVGTTGEVIVVVNGCSDNTLEVVRRVEHRFHGRIVVINITEAIGKGGAVRTGFANARGRLIGFVDADGATTTDEFDRLRQRLANHDGIIASRWMSGSKVFNRTSVLRRMASRVFVILTRLLFGLPYHDTQCGAKLFTRQLVDTVLPYLRQRDMSFDVELLVFARRLGFDVIEAPTVWTDYASATFTSPRRFIRASLGMLYSLIALKRRTFRKATV